MSGKPDSTALETLLADLAARDIRLFVSDGRLGFDAPPGALTELLKERIRADRAALIDHLSVPVVVPLSSGQARMWFINRLNHGSGDYTEHLAYEFVGALDLAALERAVGMVVARHGSLRAQFRDGKAGPEMVVPTAGSFSLPIVHLAAEAVDAALVAAAHRPIDLASDPHVQFTLFVSDGQRHILSVSAHHAAWDGWSNGVFASDLELAYGAAVAGQGGLPPLRHDITDRRPPTDPVPVIERRRQALTGFPTELCLPADRPRPKAFDTRGAAIDLRIVPESAEAIASVARRIGATPTMVILAAWGVSLSQIAGVEKLLVGVPTAGRRDDDEEALIGYLSETAVVPIDTGGAGDFEALAIRVREATLAALGDADAPFERLVEALVPGRAPDATPLVQVLFSMQPARVRAPSLGEAAGRVLARHNEAARADLALNLEPAGDGGWNGTLTYAAALFDRSTVIGWADMFLSQLQDLPSVWNRPLSPALPSDGDFATPTERRLAALWGEFLRAPPTARDDDFFMLGGHSLLLMRLVNRINESDLGHIDLADAMEASTLARMAACLDRAPSAVEAADVHLSAPSQEGIFLACRDDPDSVTWLVPMMVRLGRRVEVSVAAQALSDLVARHPAMRSTLFECDGAVMERVAPAGPVEPTVHEGLDAAGRSRLMTTELSRPMDLVTGPLYRFHLLRNSLDLDEDAIFLVAHHTMIDGWSLGIIQNDLLALIERAETGTGELPPLRVTSAEIGAHRRATLDDAHGRKLREYWTKALDGMDLGIFPAPRVPPLGAARVGRRLKVEMPKDTVEALTRIARTGGVTETAALIAVVSTLVARLKGDGRDTSVATPFAVRIRPEDAEVVGCFADVLPIRLSGGLDRSFASLLTATNSALRSALVHQDYPLRRIIEDRMRADGGEIWPTFDMVTVLEAAEPGLQDWFDPSIGCGKYDFALILGRRDDGGINLTVEYDALARDEADARAATEHLCALLLDAAQRPQAPIGDLALFTDEERRAVTEVFPSADAPADYPRDISTLAAWQDAVHRYTDRTALIDVDGTRLSFADLDRRASEIAATLSAAGVAGPVVAMAMERGTDAIAAILAIWKIGAAYLPIDVKWPMALLARLATDAEAVAILADAASAPRLFVPSGMIVVRVDQPAPSADFEPVRRLGGDAAYVMFTSGTTGTPKGVVVPHRGILRLAFDRALLPISSNDVGVHGAPLAFDATTLELWPLLLNGASIRVLSDEELLDPKRLAATLADVRATIMWLTGGLFNRVVDEAVEAFAGLRLVLTGGETMSPVHARRFLTAHPAIRLINAYGPTENTCLTTTRTVTPLDLVGLIPIGRPIAGTQAYIVDQRLNPAPIGSWGELVCGGDGVAIGYAGRPDLTAKSFVELPWGSHPRVYRTGDRARFRRDGSIEFGGRADGQVKIRGQRIEIEAIETALIACDGVRDAAVLVVGEGVDRLLIAVVVADRSRESEWRRDLAQTLPVYMLPAQFVIAANLPVNINGKRDRRALLARVEAAGRLRPVEDKAPRNAAEVQVLRLFEDLFPGATIDLASDFFQLGGHSLLAMQLANRLTQTTGAQFALRDLFAARTVAAIAALIPTSTGAAVSTAAAKSAADDGDYPLSPGQERLWVLQRLFPDTGAYNVPVILDIAGPCDEVALDRALAALEERHHALRLRVVDGDDGPRQRLQSVGGLRATVVDLTSAPDPQAAATVRQNREIVRPFRLEAENGARAILLRIGADRRRLMLVLHHSVCDGWSLGPLFRDLAAFYARENGDPSPLPPPPAHVFEAVAANRRAFSSSPQGQKLIQLWVERLTPPVQPLNLPTDRPRRPMPSFGGSIVTHRFSANLSDSLLRLARSEGATPFGMGAALVTAFLSRITCQTDIAVGTLVSGRSSPETNDMVGFLVNTLVLRCDLGGDPTFRRHLSDTRVKCMQVISDQDCSFETVVDALGAKRQPGRNPLFDVMIVWQDTEASPPIFPGATVEIVEPDFPFAKFDMSFDLGLENGGLICRLEYASDLFDRQTAESFLDRLDAMAAAVIAHPDMPVGDLPIMAEDERVQVVETFNATARPFDVRRTIPRPFLDRLDADGGRPAVLRDDAAPVSYRAFAGLAGRVAGRLIEAGARPGDSIALIGPRSLDLLAAIHGVLMAGCAYVPLGADQPEARIASMLDDLGHPLVLAAAESRAVAERIASRVLDLTDGGSAEPVDLATPDSLAYVLFTSGSTGRPKGVAIEHHAVLNRILWMAETFPIGPGDVVLQKTPVTFDVSVWELFWWSWTGAAVALPPPGTERDPEALVDFVDRHGVTVLHFVPSMLAELISYLEATPSLARRLGRLRYVFASGEALDTGLVERFNRLLFGPFGVELHNLYGPTEATVDVTWQACSPWTGGDVVPIGRPIANTAIYILDEAGRAQPIGVPGEISIGGPQVARGYVGRPEQTAECFVSNPFRSGGRLYHTGDLGRYRRDGRIEYLGRIDNQVKIRGQRIEPGEVERALESHPAVERAFVVRVVVAGLAELRAFVATKAAVTSADLRAHLRSRVTEAMIPARFLRLIDAPLTSSGKTDRKALKGEPLDSEPTTAGTAAAELVWGEEEEAVRAIWKALLPESDPSLRDGFFEAGGNSLLVIRLHARLEAGWPGAFAVADLFALSTIAEQAQRVREHTGRAEAPRPGAGVTPPDQPLPTGLSPVSTQATVSVQASEPDRSSPGAIAIVGMAVRLAGAETVDAMWRDVIGGIDRVRTLPAERVDDVVSLSNVLGQTIPRRFREAAYLDDVVNFDPRRFRMSPADASLLDPEQRLFLDTASRALEDGGRGGLALDGANVGVFVGGAPGSAWRDAVAAAFPERLEQVFALNVPSNIATRLSFLRDWHGPAMLIDTACSSALTAVHTAVRALRAGDCDWALAGGAKVIAVPPNADVRVTIDSSTGRTRAFSDGADGTGMGEGAAVFLLRTLDAALRDGDPIHAVIRGTAVNQDGASSGLTAPNPAAQAAVIRAAAADAGIPLATLSHIEAHGTGTALGDPIEIEGLTRAFAAETAETGFATVVSGKGNYGHLDGAAGAMGLTRAVLALIHDQAPPQPFFTRPNPHIAFDRAPVWVPTEPTPLADRGCPRRAGVSAFGLSGINAHVVIEIAPTARPLDVPVGWVAVCLSAASETDLGRLAGDIVAALRTNPDLPLAAIARTLADGREAFDHRAAVWVRDRGDLMARLAVFAVAPAAVDGLIVTGMAERAHAEHTVVVASLTEQAAREAAAVFVAGARPVWPSELVVGRVHLPAARPARRRLFPEFPAISRRQTAPARPTNLADLIGPAIARGNERAYVIDLHSPQFWPSAEHELNGVATLVGAAFPALVAEVTPGPVRLRDIRWIRPLRPVDVAAGTVELSIAAAGAVTLSAADRDGRRSVYAEAIVEAITVAPATTVMDIDAVLKRLGPTTEAPSFDGDAGIVHVSQRWSRLLRSTGNAEETLAWFSSPDDGEDLRLHPALLDAMIGTALTEPGHVPTGCAELVQWGAIPTDPAVHAHRRRTTDGIEADIQVVDPATGRVAMALNGFRLTRLAKRRTGGDTVLAVPVWQEQPGPARDPGCPVVVIGASPLAERMATYLSAVGRLAARCGETVDEVTLRRIGASDGPAIILVPDAGPEIGRRTVLACRAIMGALQAPLRLLGLGTGAWAVNGVGPVVPDQALVYGAITCAGQEEPMLSSRYVDTDDATPPEDLLIELGAVGDGPSTIAWRGGHRLIRRFDIAHPGAKPNRLPSSGCVVISGGVGGFALALAPALAQDGRVTLVLLSRSGVAPSGDDAESLHRRTALAELRASGTRIEMIACDVADRRSLTVALDRVRREFGPITGVVHHASSSRGGFMMNEAPDAAGYAETIAAKTVGARLLDELTRGDRLDLFLHAGSLTALTGAAGHAAYTGANAFLEALAAEQAAEGVPVLVIDWCGLRDMGMAARMVGIQPGMINADEARSYLAGALSTGATEVAVIEASLGATLAMAPASGSPGPASEDNVPEATVSPEPVPPVLAGGNRALEAALSVIWAETLGYDTVAADADFYELGGDSIAGMRIVERIVRDLGRPASLVDLMDAGTIAALARRLGERADAGMASHQSTIRPAAAAERYPVAWEQMAVLKAEAAADMGTAYNLPVGFALPDGMDETLLRSALAALVDRHEILRTRFHRGSGDGEPTMEVLPSVSLEIETLEVAAHADVPAALDAWIRPFDLWNGRPPVRFVVPRMADRACAVMLDVHHALADALSMEILLDDTIRLIAGVALETPKLQLKDYAVWSRTGAGVEGDAAARAFWLGQFGHSIPKLDLPADRPRPPLQTWRAETVQFAVPRGLVDKVRAFAGSEHTTSFVVMTTAWSLLLARYARTDDLVIAVPVDARTGVDMARMPGMLVSLLPLRLMSPDGETIGAAIRRVHALFSDAMRHRGYGLGRLLADLAPPTAPDRATLSEVTFSYMNFAETGGDAQTASGFTPLSSNRREGKADLGLYARDLPDAIGMAIEYYADIFQRDRIERMAGHFLTLLSALVDTPRDMAVSALPLIEVDERAQLAAWGQGQDLEVPAGRSLFDAFLVQVEATPAAPALDDGAERYDYRTLANYALSAAATLRAVGVEPGDRVVLRLDREPVGVIWTLAVAAIGATYVPIDPDWPAERTAWIIDDCAARVVVGDGGAIPPGVTTISSRVAFDGTAPTQPTAKGETPAYIMYTSGSTGHPKGVIVGQRSVMRLASADPDIGLRADDVILCTGSPAFDATTYEIWATLLNGGRLCVASGEDVFDPAALAAAIRTSGATVLWLTAGLFHRQIDVAPDSLASLRLVVAGGDKLSPTHVRRAMSVCPTTVFVDAYGPTENTTFTTAHRIGLGDVEPGPIPIGRPIAGTRVAIIEASGSPSPIGVWGEIVTGGDGLAVGYLNRPDLTEQAFLTDPRYPERRIYHTGDLGRFRSDGVIEFGRRLDDQIKVRGFRVELGEIEQTLTEHPGVGGSAAAYIADGVGGGDIVAFVTPSGEPVNTADLRAWVAVRLPAYAIPRRFIFVPSLPISTTGKVDRRRLVDALPPETDESNGEPPRNDTERLVARVFSEVFEQPINDRLADFVALGGHSLSAIRVVNRLAEASGVRIAMRDFFATSTVSGLAALIQGKRVGEDRIPKAPDQPSYPAGHAQIRLYLAHSMDKAGASAFNISTALPAGYTFDCDALHEALRRLVRRQESLRTSFIEVDGNILQCIAPTAEPALVIENVSASDDPTTECLRLIRRDVGTAFDLTQAPLLRARAIWTGASGWIVLLVLHHIVGDGWSMRILFHELSILYRDARAGMASALPSLPIAYRDFTRWSAGKDWAEAAHNRRAALIGAPDQIALPVDHPPPPQPSHRGDTVSRALPPAIAAALAQLGRERGTTTAAVGLALFAGLLHRLTRQADLVIGMGVAGRERVEVEELIGFFVNVLPIRVQVDDDTEFTTLVDRTSHAILAAMDHRDYPFDLLVRDIAPRRTGTRQPLINVVFEYQRFDLRAVGGEEQVFGDVPQPMLDPALADALGDALRTPTAKHDLLLFMIEHTDGTTEFQLEFDTDIIDRPTAETWLAYLERFARAVADSRARDAAE